MLRNIELRFEDLEERTMPSGNAVGGFVENPIAIIAPLPPVHQSTHALTGIGHGTYSSNSLIVDAGVTYQLSGSGHFGQLGQVTISGSIHGVGMIASGKAQGTLTFTGAHGSVTVEVIGPNQAGFAPLPTWYHYHITSATGDYKSLKDSGTLRIDFHPSPMMEPPMGAHTGVIPGMATGTFRIAI